MAQDESQPVAQATDTEFDTLMSDMETEISGNEEEKDEASDNKRPRKEAADTAESDSDEKEEKDEDEIKLTDAEDEINLPAGQKAILKKYPTLFKEFPSLKTAYYKNQQYSELLPTIDDARDAVRKSETLDKFEGELLEGSIENLFKGIKEADENAFYKVVDNLLPTLRKVNSDAFHHVISLVGNDLIYSLAREARNAGNKEQREAMEQAAHMLNQFLFGTSEFKPSSKLSKGGQQTEEVNKEREEFNRERLDYHQNDVSSRVSNSITSAIDQYIDPKGSMTAYVKKNATRECLESVHASLSNDRGYQANLDRLWRAAFEDKFSTHSLNKIRTFVLGRAKQILPNEIRKARSEALKGLTKRASDETESRDRRGPITVGRSTSSSNSGRSSGKGIQPGEKTVDFFLRD